jgi:hypothetical protein
VYEEKNLLDLQNASRRLPKHSSISLKKIWHSQKLMTPKPEALLLVGTIPSIIRRWWKDLMT